MRRTSSLALPRGLAARAYDHLRGSSTGLVVLSLTIGAGAGLGAIVFRWLIASFTRLFSGYNDYSAVGPAAHPLLPQLGPLFVVLAPVLGGLLYGPLIDRFAPEARGHGVPEVMLAVAEKGGRIRPQVAVIKSLASALCIGSGGSVGREGPIVQIGSAWGSALGQALRIPESRLRLLVACGAAGGISATFNAPIAGVFFALELILRDFETESFGVVVLASVVANAIGRAAIGATPFLTLPPFELVSYGEYALYALLGVVAAVVGLAFVRVLYGAEDVADRLWRGPDWLRPAVGGILLGLVLLAMPQLYGVGYPVLQAAIEGHYALGFLLLLLAGKVLATSLTISIGGSGGVFAPSLFMGAMLGTAFGQLMQVVLPGAVGPAGAYGLVGMGAVFAGAARAPITAVLIIFELTGEYAIILPLMFAIALAAGVSNLLSHDTIYTLKLRRRGIDLRRGRGANLMELLRVRDAAQPVPEGLVPELPLAGIVARFAREGQDTLPVVDGHGAYRGTVTSLQLEEAMRDNVLDATAGELAVETATLRPDQSLEQALQELVRRGATGLPVVEDTGGRVIGWLSHADVLHAYARRLEASAAQVAEPDASAASPPGRSSRAIPAPRLHGYRVLDLTLSAAGRPTGCRVGDLNWPRSVLLLAVRRNGATFDATEDLELRQGDRLTVLAPAGQAERLVESLGAVPATEHAEQSALGTNDMWLVG